VTFPYFVLCGVVALLWLAAVAYTRRERRRAQERLAALLERAKRELG
jgi:hypothetical protein